MEELEQRFGAHLCLSEKERTGLVFEEEDIGDLWKGSQFTLVARVMTHKSVNREAFESVFTRLWSGNDGVSIKEIGERRFLVWFVNQNDKRRVLDMEPWTFRDGLVLLAEVQTGADARTVLVDTGVFWVQLHGISPLNMTTMVATKVGTLIGRVLVVDQANGDDCIGRFLRVRIRFDVGQPLMRGTFVSFPGEGPRWIDFKYEFLPEYCLVCGCIGHPSRTCLELCRVERDDNVAQAAALLAFAGLEAMEDLRGRRLKGSTHRLKPSVSPGRGSGSDDLNHGFQGRRMSGGSRWGSKEGSRADQRGSWRGEKVQGAELEDTAISPHKSDSCLSAVADLIRRQREGEERDRQLREVAWEAGLGFGRGDFRDGALSQNSASNTISSSIRQGDHHASYPGSGCMQADKGVGAGLDLNIAAEEQVPTVDDGDSVGEQGGGDNGVGRPWSLTQDSDPFNLGPLIAGAQRSEEGRVKRKRLGNMGGQDANLCRLGKRQRYGYSGALCGVSDTLWEVRRGLTFVDDLDRAVETSLNRSPRSS